MNIHEHQAKELLKSCGIPLMPGFYAHTPQEAEALAQSWVNDQTPSFQAWVKAQIHAGGRGKGGGVLQASTPQEVGEKTQTILSKPLVTPQTSTEGLHVSGVYVEQSCPIDTMFYVSLLWDRHSGCVTVVASQKGGGDIEQIAQDNPEDIVTLTVDSLTGLSPFYERILSHRLGLTREQDVLWRPMIRKLYQLFLEKDCTLIEINPLAWTQSGTFVALDAKMRFDDHAMERQPQILAFGDTSQEDPTELLATSHHLSYVALDGRIGCVVNGAGLAMATMDMIKHHGGTPANFLDIGGGATPERIKKALDIVLSEDKVEGVLVNVFGGIIHCDQVAQGIVDALQDGSIKKPLVVRLEGTNQEEGQRILEQSKVPVTFAKDLNEATLAVVRILDQGPTLCPF